MLIRSNQPPTEEDVKELFRQNGIPIPDPFKMEEALIMLAGGKRKSQHTIIYKSGNGPVKIQKGSGTEDCYTCQQMKKKKGS
jgi:hypothetical protein